MLEPRGLEEVCSELSIYLYPDGAFILDEDWRIRALNPVAERLLTERLPAGSRTEVLGQVLWSLFPTLIATPFGTAYLRAREEGVPITVEVLGGPGEPSYEARAVPHGSRLVVFLRDVTSRRESELAREKIVGRLALLQDMTTKLCAAASASEVVEVIARGALEALHARRLSVALPEMDGRSLRVLSRESMSGGPGYRLSQVPMEANLPMTRVFRAGRPEWSGSMACLPMFAKGTPLAVLCLTFAPLHTIDQPDRDFLLALAHQGALALERARLFDKEQAARAEAEFQRTRLQAVVMQAPMAVCLMRGPQHLITLDNPLHQAHQGDSGLVGQTVRQALPLQVRQGLLDVLDRVYTWGERYAAREHRVARDPRTGEPTEERFFNFSYEPLRSVTGHVDGVAFFSYDVTDHVRARREVEQLAERQQFLYEASSLLGGSLDSVAAMERLMELVVPRFADCCAVHVITEEGRVEQLAGLYQDAEQERVARQLLMLQPISLSAPHGIGKVLRTGASEWVSAFTEDMLPQRAFSDDVESMMRSLKLSSYICVPLVARERTLGALMLAQSPSGRHYSQADLTLAEELARRAALCLDNARLYRDAQEAIRLRDEFLSIASHELKTPLTVLRLQLAFLERHLPQDVEERLRGKLDLAQRQSRRLSQLISLLLDVGRIVTGRVSLERSEMDLTRLVQEVLDRLGEVFVKAGSPVTLESPGRVMGHWDALRLEQVVVNLLSNAARYGEGKPVTLRVESDETHVRFIVRDEGVGIAPEDLPRIFSRFERAITVRHYGGLGLGLYISREIVESHGGRLLVESAPGKGSTFTMELPHQAPEA
ncbi:MAG: ATP-binding protein [Cystobacter sp.]